MTITTRAGKGSALTHAELDGNFDHFSARSHFGTVANEAAMVALSLAVPGASCTRTDTGTVWILATGTYATAGNWRDTGSGDTLPQYAISGATSITRADHCNRVGVNSTASNYTLTIQTDALGGYTGNEIVYGFQGGTGTVTIAASGATLRTPTGGKPVTTSQGDFVSAQRIGVDTWAITSLSATGSGSTTYLSYTIAAPISYTLTASPVAVPGTQIVIPANTWQTGGLLRLTVMLRHTTGSTAYTSSVQIGAQGLRYAASINATNGNVYASHAEIFNLGGGSQLSTVNNSPPAYDSSNAVPSVHSFDTATDLTVELYLNGNAGDVVQVAGLVVEILNPA